MIVDGQAMKEVPARVDVAVGVQQGLVSQVLPSIGGVLHDLPGIAIERAEGLGRFPVERGHHGVGRLGPSGREHGEGNARDDPDVVATLRMTQPRS